MEDEKPSSFTENGIHINTKNTVITPKKNGIVFNPYMHLNRSLALYALGAYIESGWCLNKSLRCLDALGATGVAGLSWAKNFPQVQVTINDPLESACKIIRENEISNDLNIEVTQQDVSVLLLHRTFDFIFLDCYGSSVHYLDAVFRNVPKNGMLIITSTDDAALYGKAPDVTLRNYGGYIAKTFYSKELAARLIIGAVVRAAARCNKGIEVMSSIAVKSHITLIVKVVRGPAAATQCVNTIRKLIHCCICEDRAFLPQSVYPVENPYSLLYCDCRSRSSGHVAIELGPIWSGLIFESDFCIKMLKQANKLGSSQRIITLLQTVLTESLGGQFNPKVDRLEDIRKGPGLIGLIPERSFKGGPHHKVPPDQEQARVKKLKMELCPPFYFNLHRHSPKGYDLGKLNKIVKFIQESNYRASRTHFDPEAIRTSASLKDFNELLIQFSKGSRNKH